MRRFSTLIISILSIFQCAQAFSAEENFLLINGVTDEIVLELGSHINERVTPACSFNIALSLMGYDAEVLKDEKTPVWDFQEGYDDYSESWKTSQTPQSWMARSCVWYSKLLGLELGLETMQGYLSSFEYGNQDMSGGLTEPAWISSSLKISPKEQVGFVQKMLQRKLLVSSDAVQMTKVLLLKEAMPHGWELYGKTGLGSFIGQDGERLKVRWFVGWVEKERAFFPFAYQAREREVDVTQAVPRVKELLAEAGIIEKRTAIQEEKIGLMIEINHNREYFLL